MEQTYSGTFLKDRSALVLGGLVLVAAIVLALAVDTLASGGVDSPTRVASSGAVTSRQSGQLDTFGPAPLGVGASSVGAAVRTTGQLDAFGPAPLAVGVSLGVVVDPLPGQLDTFGPAPVGASLAAEPSTRVTGRLDSFGPAPVAVSTSERSTRGQLDAWGPVPLSHAR